MLEIQKLFKMPQIKQHINYKYYTLLLKVRTISYSDFYLNILSILILLTKRAFISTIDQCKKQLKSMTNKPYNVSLNAYHYFSSGCKAQKILQLLNASQIYPKLCSKDSQALSSLMLSYFSLLNFKFNCLQGLNFLTMQV